MMALAGVTLNKKIYGMATEPTGAFRQLCYENRFGSLFFSREEYSLFFIFYFFFISILVLTLNILLYGICS